MRLVVGLVAGLLAPASANVLRGGLRVHEAPLVENHVDSAVKYVQVTPPIVSLQRSAQVGKSVEGANAFQAALEGAQETKGEHEVDGANKLQAELAAVDEAEGANKLQAALESASVAKPVAVSKPVVAMTKPVVVAAQHTSSHKSTMTIEDLMGDLASNKVDEAPEESTEKQEAPEEALEKQEAPKKVAAPAAPDALARLLASKDKAPKKVAVPLVPVLAAKRVEVPKKVIATSAPVLAAKKEQAPVLAAPPLENGALADDETAELVKESEGVDDGSELDSAVDTVSSGTNDASTVDEDGFSGEAEGEEVFSGTNEASAKDDKKFGTEEDLNGEDVAAGTDEATSEDAEVFSGTNDASTENGDAPAAAVAPVNFLQLSDDDNTGAEAEVQGDESEEATQVVQADDSDESAEEDDSALEVVSGCDDETEDCESALAA